MRREFQAFAESPTRSKFLAAYFALRAASPRALAAEDFSRLIDLLDAENGVGVTESIARLPPIAALSPAVHGIAAQAAHAAGDAQDCELEQFLLDTCLTAMLQTGDGTADSPYVVTCTMDERHLCRVLGQVPRSQGLVNHNGRPLDAVQCVGGVCLFFDVSASVELPATQPLRRSRSRKTVRTQTKRSPCLQKREKRLSRTAR